ncbi:MAG: helix-turn-helix domain-containing protein [Firmicutes bacterium]|nr:helix-turn-helix domain-containing protein [Bacillota bacterium]
MKSNVGEIIKNLRKSLNISQEELASRLYMDRSKLSRIESGESSITVIEFLTAFSVLGFPTEDFWIAYLTWDEFKGYRLYRKIREFLKRDDVDKIRDILPPFKENPLSKQSFMYQFVTFLDILLNTNLSDSQKIGELHNALKYSIQDFAYEKICEYRFNFSELLIVYEIAMAHSRSEKTEHQEKAIEILTSIAENIDNFCLTVEEKNVILPKPQVSLFSLLMDLGDYEKAAFVCESVLVLARTYRSQQLLPFTTYSLAVCFKKTGKSTDEYMPLLIRAYHAARCIEQHDLANKIREEYDI